MEKKIHIPDPCSENWNNMTPTEKGAFCDKCKIEVVDFTKKSPEEIRNILKENSGNRLCGHIGKTQIDMLNTNYHIWKNQSISTFRSKFLYACAIVFGMTLFTGCDFFAEQSNKVGDIEEVGKFEEDTTSTCDDTLIDGMMEIEMGDIEECGGGE